MDEHIKYFMSSPMEEVYKLTIPKISTKYLDWFWKQKCVGDLHRLKIFPNVKEITESVAGLFACTHKLKIRRNRDDVLAVCVGDGQLPRTGVLLSYLTDWSVLSIDPDMLTRKDEVDNIVSKTHKLDVIMKKIEESTFNTTGYNTIVFLCVHSHALLSECAKKLAINDNAHFISMPCCVDDNLQIKPTYSYKDFGILSPQRTVNIYKDY